MRIITNAYRFWIGLFAMVLNVEYPKKRWVLKDNAKLGFHDFVMYRRYGVRPPLPPNSIYTIPEEIYQEFVQESP